MLINGYISTQCLNVWAEILNAFTSYFFNDTLIQRKAEDKIKQTHLYVIIDLVLLHSTEQSRAPMSQMVNCCMTTWLITQHIKGGRINCTLHSLHCISMRCKHCKQRSLSLGPQRCHFITSSKRTMNNETSNVNIISGAFAAWIIDTHFQFSVTLTYNFEQHHLWIYMSSKQISIFIEKWM